MKKNLCFIAAGLMTVSGACSSDPVEEVPAGTDNEVTVEIVTDIQTRAKVTTLFREGDEMNVFAKAYNKPDATDFAQPAKGTYGGGKWSLTPPVKLKEGEHTFIYALAPYQEGVTDLANIPVDISGQQDILYSGYSVPVSHTTYQAKLTMKHALSLVTFNVSSQGYAGKGVLESLSLSGEQVYTTGTMSIESGKIKGTGQETYVQECGQTITSSGWTADLPRIWSIPFSTKVDVATLTAVIDGKSYRTAFPEVEMKSGYQYIFHLVLTGYGLEFIPDQTQTISLNQETDEMGALEGYGVLLITHAAPDFTLPVLTGDNVFGSVDWGDGTTDSYAVGLSHGYGGNASRQTVIETWNSTGFELKELTGVEVIDVSGY